MVVAAKEYWKPCPKCEKYYSCWADFVPAQCLSCACVQYGHLSIGDHCVRCGGEIPHEQRITMRTLELWGD